MKSRQHGRATAARAVGVAAAALLIATAATAETRPRPQLTGNLAKDVASTIGLAPAAAPAETPDALWKQIQSASLADLQYAQALADNVASQGSKLRSACYAVWITTIQQSQGTGLKAANGQPLAQPDPHVFSSFEQLAEIADNLQPTGPLMSACAPAWTALKLSAMQFFTMVVGGGASLAALGLTVP
jgi:hypothetical protein